MKNNKLTYSFKDITSNVASKNITFDDGLYSLQDIIYKISLFTAQMDKGQYSDLIFFIPDESASKIYVTFNQTYVSIDASATNSILLSLRITIDQGTVGDGIIGNFSDKSQS